MYHDYQIKIVDKIRPFVTNSVETRYYCSCMFDSIEATKFIDTRNLYRTLKLDNK